ncbi:hypothetical protein MBLNU13_g07528t2 [Cladosporium sp. NU13]
MPPPTRPPTKPSPSTTATPTATTRPCSPETHISLAARNAAAEILQSYEQLSWHALSRNEVRPSPNPNPTQPTHHLTTSLVQSLAQTRLHFLSLLAGFTADDERAQIDWKTDNSPHAPDALPTSIYTGLEPLGGEGRRKSSSAGKGKERASLGGGGGSGRASPRTSLGGEGSGSAKKKKRSEGVGS